MAIKNHVWSADHKIAPPEFLITFHFLAHFEAYVLFIFITSLVFFYV